MATISNTPVAPVVGVQGHKSQHGGHYLAYKGQPAFALDSTLAIVQGTNNPWRPGTPGHSFYEAVLTKKPATVKAALELANSALGLKPAQAQAHLRWLYTWGGAYLQVNGALYGAQAPVVVAQEPKAEEPKAKAPKARKAK